MLEKNQAALSFIFPEIGQTSLGIPSPGELQGRREGRKNRSCEERGWRSKWEAAPGLRDLQRVLLLFNPSPALEMITCVLLEVLLGITIPVSKQGGNYILDGLYREKPY